VGELAAEEDCCFEDDVFFVLFSS
jgi:hypothetical protein